MNIICKPLLFTAIALFCNAAAVKAQSIEEIIQNMINEVSVENLSEHIQNLEEAGGTRSRIVFTPGVDSASVYIKHAFSGIPGITSVEYDTFYVSTAIAPYNEQPQVNVVATIEGDLYPEQSYVIGAHIDATADRDGNSTWGENGENWQTIEAPGADDNATGVAAILEMARIMTDPASRFTSDYTIKLVAFGAEERLPAAIYTGSGSATNHHGSIHYAERARENDEDILGMISVDMIGYNDENDYTAIVYHNTTNNLNNEAISLGDKYVSINEDYSIGLIMNESPFRRGNYSDHQSFADEGYPAILVIENAAPWNTNDYYKANPFYHKTSDTFDKLNMELVTKVTRLNLATVASFGGKVTSAGDDVSDVAGSISLSQNYPNPFNPSTNIQYRLQNPGFVNLSVYDILGNKVATLVNGTQSSGEHRVTFNAERVNGELSSGIYIYNLRTDDFVKSRKMILVK